MILFFKSRKRLGNDDDRNEDEEDAGDEPEVKKKKQEHKEDAGEVCYRASLEFGNSFTIDLDQDFHDFY